MDKGLQHVTRQFSDREALIRQLWVEDEDFHELCHDYALCLETLAHWTTEPAPQARKAEYRSLCRRLEYEIEIRIAAFQSQLIER